MAHFIAGIDVLKQLAPVLGFDMNTIKRVVIDLQFDDVARIYVELLGDIRLIEFDWAGTLKDTEIIKR